jgi:hypothetical protein
LDTSDLEKRKHQSSLFFVLLLDVCGESFILLLVFQRLLI